MKRTDTIALPVECPDISGASVASPLYARCLDSIAHTDRARWNRIYGESAEGFDYLTACEIAPPPDFEISAIAAFDDAGLCAGVPVFKSLFRLDLMLPAVLRDAGAWLYRNWPGFLTVSVLGAGSPHVDELVLDPEPTFDLPRKRSTLDAMLACLEGKAEGEHAQIICLKNVRDSDRSWAEPALLARGYSRIASLPLAFLDIPKSEAAYIASLSPKMRRSLKQKIKKAECIRVEMRSSVEGLEPQLAELREATRKRAGSNYDAFEGVSPAYYRAVMEHLGERSRLLLYWRDDVLLGFSIIVIEPGRIKEKYSGLRYPEALDYSIFFLNWMTVFRLCLAMKIPRMHAGETTYITKVRLGCKLERSWIYFKHRRPMINRLFKLLAPLAALDTTDPDLSQLGADAPYVEHPAKAAAQPQ